jgi:hypothetical protein
MSTKKLLSAIGSVFWIAVLVWQFHDDIGGKNASDAGGRTNARAIVDEQDGAELVALMNNAHDAIVARSQKQFETLFVGKSAPRVAWRAIQRYRDDYGHYELGLVTTPPGIERSVTDVHVTDLTIEAWYDFSADHTVKITPIHHTIWRFEREGEGWKLAALHVKATTSGYEGTVQRLYNTPYPTLAALNMDWEESVDPSPLLAQALRAVAREDVIELQRCATNGAVLQASVNDVELPDVHNGSRYVGGMSTTYAEDAIRKQIRGIRRTSDALETSPTGLIPFFTAYRVVSMPADCTQLRVNIAFDGDGVPAPVNGFMVDWCGAYIANKWLAVHLSAASGSH